MIESICNCRRVRIEFDNGVDAWAALVESGDSLQVHLEQLARGQMACSQMTLNLGHGRLFDSERGCHGSPSFVRDHDFFRGTRVRAMLDGEPARLNALELLVV